MNPKEQHRQEQFHQALTRVMNEEGMIDEGELLTGWVIVYETNDLGDNAHCGHFYGPVGTTTWKAMGLLEWARRYTLIPDSSTDEPED